MSRARSINQKAVTDALPNFRNLGVVLRILIFSCSLALLQALLSTNTWMDLPVRLLQIATLFAPILMISLLLLWVAQPWLNRIEYWRGTLVVNSLVLFTTLTIYTLGEALLRPLGSNNAGFEMLRNILLSVVICYSLLMYFRLRTRALSGALDDARLQVLRARIRPHFLFNTLNAVLGIMRTRPEHAETALEDMSDLFRAAMFDAQDLVRVGQEIQLSKQYLSLEELRLGDRLEVDWQIHDVPDDALIPPLLLQPLLENAVYHGIESLPQGGCIRVKLHRSGKELHLRVENPCPIRTNVVHEGNKVALRNIRERLALLFDVEARYHFVSGKDFYRVEISLPYIRERRKSRER